MRLAELIAHLTAHDVRLSADGDLLRYDGPADVLNDDLLRELRQHKAALLRWLSGERPGVVRVPASRVQRRIWTALQRTLDPGAYNVTMRVVLTGPLDPDALRGAYADLLARHDVLRTRLVAVGEEVMQEIDPPGDATIPVLDLSALPPDARARAVDDWCRREAGRPFDITAEPPIRLLLARQSGTDWVLLVVQQHFATDGWSLALLFDELSALYTAQVTGEPAGLTPAPQYAEFAAWEAEHLTPARVAQSAEFWRRELAGAPFHVGLPYDREPPAEPTSRAGLHTASIAPDLGDAVAHRARECGATPYPFLASVFAVLMADITGVRDLVLSGSVANRARERFERMLGVFTNNVILRVRVDRARTFTELVRDTTQMFYRGLDHQSVPFWTIVEELSLPYGPGTVFSQIKFTVNNTPPPVLRFPGIHAHVRDEQPEGTKFDFGVLVVSEEAGQTVLIEYRVERFDRATVEGFGQRYIRLLRLATEDPDIELAEAVRRSYQSDEVR